VCVCACMHSACVLGRGEGGGERERDSHYLLTKVEVSGHLGFDSMLLSKTACP